MRIWDEIRQELEKVRQEFAGDIAGLRAEVAEIRAAQQGSAPSRPPADAELGAGQPT